MKSNQVEKQMSFFDVGGFNDGGAPETDPVSGNEIPPGSMEEEVRDDMPAMLSEGEYVVPADVLRYYGMKFFEDLRAQAKTDLQAMESEGRMGGEPTEGSGEEVSAEEMAMLQEVMSSEPQMNQGGLMPPVTPIQESTPVFAPQGSFKTRRFNEGGMSAPKGWSPTDTSGIVGNSVFNSTTSETNPAFSSSLNTTIAKTYRDPKTGAIATIIFVGGKPTTPIPEGYEEVKSAATEQQEKVEDENEMLPDFGGLADQDPEAANEREGGAGLSDEDFEAMAEDPIGFGQNALSGAKEGGLLGLAENVPGMIGMGASAISGLNEIAALGRANGARAVAEEMGLDTSALDKDIADFKGGMSKAGKALAETGMFGSGKQTYNSYTDKVAARAQMAKEVKSQVSKATSQTQAAMSDTTNAAPSAPSAPSGPSAGPSSDANEDGAGNRNKGGLVKRRKKSKK